MMTDTYGQTQAYRFTFRPSSVIDAVPFDALRTPGRLLVVDGGQYRAG
jgi:hypothetical protein